MTVPTLYEISGEYLSVLDALTDPENDIPADAISDTLDGIEGQLKDKAQNVAMYMRNLESVAASIKEAEQAMAARRKSIEKRTQWLNDYIKRSMESTGITKIESPWFVLSIVKNPPALEITSEEDLPEAYKHARIVIDIDKAAIKDALKSGDNVPGAALTQGTRLVIK